MADLMGDNKKANGKTTADPKPLRYKRTRIATATEYSVYHCEGPVGCGESVSRDMLNEHAARQHGTYDFDIDEQIAQQ